MAFDGIIVYTVAYSMLAICVVAPPTEFVSAGFTIQNLFSNFLGSEQMNFVGYHIRRTTVTLLVHALIPIGFYIGMIFVDLDADLSVIPMLDIFWLIYLVISLLIPLTALLLAFYWSRKQWSNHPIATTLQCLSSSGSNWRSVASSINLEFRRIDKFTTGSYGRRLIVTDSWLIMTSTYVIHVAHQSDTHLALIGSEEHEVHYDSSTGVQFLNLLVSSADQRMKPFKIRLNAVEYRDLKDKLRSPIINARNVVIRQSLSDRFLEAFRYQVDQNQIYVKPAELELEPCIGCMQSTANVKLQKLCSDSDEGTCIQCYCRPMWCIECMGKWFASRQDQSQPETWLSSRSPCPTCRSTFCMLDICKINIS